MEIREKGREAERGGMGGEGENFQGGLAIEIWPLPMGESVWGNM